MTHLTSPTGKTKSLNYNCSQCQIVLHEQEELDEHIKKEHGNEKYSDEWNCNDCAYQANRAEDLIKQAGAVLGSTFKLGSGLILEK